jgi:exodeoxyribonuclease VII large subunit
VDLAQARRQQIAARLGTRLGQWPTVIMMRDRDTRHLGRRLERGIAGRVSRQLQRFEALRRRLEARDLRRIVAGLRTRTVAAEGRLRTALGRRQQLATSQTTTLAARLDALSPLAVLGRGYAVCWNEARTSIIRTASAVAPGETVQVTLAEGELTCRVDRAERG